MSEGKGRGIERDSELGRPMSSEDLSHLGREESRQRLRMGIDQGEKRRQLEEQSGDKYSDLVGKKPGY
jgi:hypothetical protein